MGTIKYLKIEFITACLAFAMMASILYVKPIIGMADSGDFGRIMAATGLGWISEEPDQKHFDYIISTYSISKFKVPLSNLEAYPSSQVLLVKAAIFINKLVRSKKFFDIRVLSFLYVMILSISIFAIHKYSNITSNYVKYILSILMLIVFIDVGYIAYFNSLYGEATSYVFLFLVLASGLYIANHSNPSFFGLLIFLIALIIFSTAKAQNIPLAFIFLIFLAKIFFEKRDVLWRTTIVVLTFVMATSSIAVHMFTPQVMQDCHKYQAIFYGIIRYSPTPEKDLEELGIDPKFAVLKGTNFFMTGLTYDLRDPTFQWEIYDKITHLKILTFYLKHPDRFLEKLSISAENGFYIRPAYLGNYERAPGVKPLQMATMFSLWSTFKANTLSHSLFLVVSFFFLYFAVLTYYYVIKWRRREKTLFVDIFMTLGLIGAVSFVVPVLGDGEADHAKHLFLFNVAFDMMVVASITWMFSILPRWDRIQNFPKISGRTSA